MSDTPNVITDSFELIAIIVQETQVARLGATRPDLRRGSSISAERDPVAQNLAVPIMRRFDSTANQNTAVRFDDPL